MARSSKRRTTTAPPSRGATSQSTRPPSGKGGRGKPGRPGGRPPVEVRPAGLGDWIGGARPQTLPMAIAPVAIGFGASTLHYSPWYEHWARALLCLVVALALQIGVNYANDYSDGIRGTDRDRVGPPRLVGSGRATPKQVLTAALVFFGIGALAGLVVVWRSGQWWLLLVGVVALAAAWFYTGGKRPYGYLPLGELAVLLFFGIVPAVGTAYVLSGQMNVESWVGGVATGLFAAAVLHVNNLRDQTRDAVHGKRTLSVLLGRTGSRILLTALILAPFGILAFYALFYPLAPYVYFGLMIAVPAIVILWTSKTPRELVLVLQLTLLTALLYGLGVAAAVIF